jgi:hypothetical protein
MSMKNSNDTIGNRSRDLSVCSAVSKLMYSDFFTNQIYNIVARSKTWVCGRSLAGNLSSRPVGGIDVCLL